ncbi:hypothetical protein D3C85_1571200 [compost metagenome]
MLLSALLQGKYAFSASDRGHVDKFVNGCCRISFYLLEGNAECFGDFGQNRAREANGDCTEGSAEHDKQCAGDDQRADMTAIPHITAD